MQTTYLPHSQIDDPTSHETSLTPADDGLMTEIPAPAELVESLRTTWRSPVELTSPDALTPEENAEVPQVWLTALKMPAAEGVRHMVDQWERVIPGRLPLTTQRLREAAFALYLGRRGDELVLVYALSGTFGRKTYSTLVCTAPQPEPVSVDYIARIPLALRAFHTQLHDETESPLHGGMMAFADLELVSAYDDPRWPMTIDGRDPQFDPDVDYPDLSRVVLMFNDAASSRVCVNLTDDPDSTAGWDWFEGSMDRMPDFWAQLDGRLAQGISDWSDDR